MGLDEPRDVGEVLLPLAGPARGVLGGPDLPLRRVTTRSRNPGLSIVTAFQ